MGHRSSEQGVTANLNFAASLRPCLPTGRSAVKSFTYSGSLWGIAKNTKDYKTLKINQKIAHDL
jgi:hypothetical protein